jgi:hypothetical protein
VEVRIIKKHQRNALVCTRADGSVECSDLGPQLPYHDLAHYVVEKRLGFEDGFYGHIERGFSVAQLSAKDVIRTLPVGSLIAEVITRGLQALAGGACRPENMAEQVNWELQSLNSPYRFPNDPELIHNLHREYKDLLNLWDGATEGESILLHW